MTESPQQHPDVVAAKEQCKSTQDQWVHKRLQLETAALYDPELQTAIRAMCARDIFFFFDHFLWTVDPRQTDPAQQVVPFIMYDYQREIIQWLLDAVNATQDGVTRKNLVITKSRDMGVSWLCCMFMLWHWLFHGGSFLIGSRKQEEIDVLGDMSTPMEKIRFNLRRLPPYLMPPNFDWKAHNKHLCLINPNGGEITGEAPTQNFARGGRQLMIMFDEFAAMLRDEMAWAAASQSTNIRLAVSTPNGPHNKFYDLATGKDDEQCDVKRLHWTMHPLKAAGMQLVDGKPTSPWYESQKLTMTAEDIAKELDINFASSIKGLVFYDYSELHRVENYSPDKSGCVVRVFDPGLTFAVMFLHIDNYNRVTAFREIVTENARIRDVAEQVLQVSAEIDELYGAMSYYDYGDPAGATRNGAGAEQPEYVVLANEYDIDVDYQFMVDMPARLRVKNRIQAIRKKLGEFVFQKQTPGLVVDVKHCPLLDEALKSGYRYKINQYTREPSEQIDEQHPFEDVVDCLGYGILGKLGLSNTSSGDSKRGFSRAGLKWNGQLRRGRRYA